MILTISGVVQLNINTEARTRNHIFPPRML
uniref:Uncharacterized protein n=1 Tax=Arundo donax TaxID=35708 RepID=A0A0A9BV24_ARUDO